MAFRGSGARGLGPVVPTAICHWWFGPVVSLSGAGREAKEENQKVKEGEEKGRRRRWKQL